MSRREMVERVVARSYRKACLNPFFAHQLAQDPDSALGEILQEVKSSGGLPEEEAKRVIAEAGQVIELAPFLKREEVTKIIKDLIEHTAKAFTSTVLHCRILFWLGVSIAAGVVSLEVYGILGRVPLGAALAGGLLGGGLGFGFIYTALVQRPLEQMQNSAGNLAQIQIIFIGFLDQVSILMAKSGSGGMKGALKVIDRLGGAMEDAVSRIERFYEHRAEAPRR